MTNYISLGIVLLISIMVLIFRTNVTNHLLRLYIKDLTKKGTQESEIANRLIVQRRYFNTAILIVCTIFLLVSASLFVLVPSTSTEITSINEYDARLDEICKDEKETSQRFAACAWAVLLNDEMTSGNLRMFAQQEQYAIEARSALNLSDKELLEQLLKNMDAMRDSGERYVSETVIETNALLTEFKRRNLTDSHVEELRLLILQKWGPCWGIPEGLCRE